MESTLAAERLEAATDACWPSPTILSRDWCIRLGSSSQLRPTSATLLPTFEAPIAEAVPAAEQIFAEHLRIPVFQIIHHREFIGHRSLAAYLTSDENYAIAPTSIVYAKSGLSRVGSILTTVSVSLIEPADAAQVPIVDGWKDRDDVASALPLVRGPSVFALSLDGRKAVGIARGVLHDGNLGLFNFFVAPDHRREGRARLLMQHLFNWGAQRGAAGCFLQVESTNSKAISLYESLGMSQAYRYGYFVRTS